MRLKRLLAYWIDLSLGVALALIIYGILVCFQVQVILPMICIIPFGFLMCKDCFNGASPGKHFTKIQVTDRKTGEIATPCKCVVRNLFYLWGIVDVLPLFFDSKNFRIGDFVAKTEVKKYDETLLNNGLQKSMIAIAYVILGMLVMEFIYYSRAKAFGLL